MSENRNLDRYDELTLNRVLEPTMALVNQRLDRDALRLQHAAALMARFPFAHGIEMIQKSRICRIGPLPVD